MYDKMLFDKSGYIVSVGDKIVYVTDGPRVNYGVVEKIERVKPYGYEHWKVTVLKTGGWYLEKPRKVILTEPTIFLCAHPPLYQPKVTA
jgi:hypothetical protein